MSMERSRPSAAALTPTSYLVLGLLAREGPSTPYELKRHVAATIGHFWSFPHALLYKEPARLAGLGLLTEERELDGRRRRLFTITPAGREALRAWLSHPARQPTELRDLALLQLFFADLESTAATLAIAEEQLALHQRQLADYEADQLLEGGPDSGPGSAAPSSIGAASRSGSACSTNGPRSSSGARWRRVSAPASRRVTRAAAGAHALRLSPATVRLRTGRGSRPGSAASRREP